MKSHPPTTQEDGMDYSKMSNEDIDILASHIQRVVAARRAFNAECNNRNSTRVDSRAVGDAEYALCSFIERRSVQILAALKALGATTHEVDQAGHLRRGGPRNLHARRREVAQ